MSSAPTHWHPHTLTSVSPESRALVTMTELPPVEVIHTHTLHCRRLVFFSITVLIFLLFLLW